MILTESIFKKGNNKMSNKKSKNFSKDAPEIYNMDDIGYMSDDALYDRANRLENERSRMLNSGREPYLWEVEIAYLRREQTMRKTRTDIHQEYLQKFSANVKNNNSEASVEEPTATELN
jgi:hypothetical protein